MWIGMWMCGWLWKVGLGQVERGDDGGGQRRLRGGVEEGLERQRRQRERRCWILQLRLLQTSGERRSGGGEFGLILLLLPLLHGGDGGSGGGVGGGSVVGRGRGGLEKLQMSMEQGSPCLQSLLLLLQLSRVFVEAGDVGAGAGEEGESGVSG